MKIAELYESRNNRIPSERLAEFKTGLTISDVKIVGKNRKGALLLFEETSLEHKCNRTDVFDIAKMFDTNDTDDFVGKKIFLKANEKGTVRIDKDHKYPIGK